MEMFQKQFRWIKDPNTREIEVQIQVFYCVFQASQIFHLKFLAYLFYSDWILQPLLSENLHYFETLKASWKTAQRVVNREIWASSTVLSSLGSYQNQGDNKEKGTLNICLT